MARQGVSFELLGVADLKVSLDALRDDVRLRLEDAIDDSAHAIQTRAKTKVPIDKGDLARAIQLAGKGLARLIGLEDRSVPSRGGTNSAHLNPWVYGQFVEFGLRNRNMPAQPFMGPAVDEEEAAHYQRVTDAVNEAIGG